MRSAHRHLLALVGTVLCLHGGPLHVGNCSPAEGSAEEFGKEALMRTLRQQQMERQFHPSSLKVHYAVIGYTNDHRDTTQSRFRFTFMSCGEMWKARHFIQKNNKEDLAFEEAYDGVKYFASSRVHKKKTTLLIAKNASPVGPLPLSTPYMNIPFHAFSMLTFLEEGVVPTSMKAPHITDLFSLDVWEQFVASAEDLSDKHAASDGQIFLQVANRDVGESNQTRTKIAIQIRNGAVGIANIAKYRIASGMKSYELIVDDYLGESINGIRVPKKVRFVTFRAKDSGETAYGGEAEVKNFKATEGTLCSREDFQLHLADYEQVIDLDNRMSIPIPSDD